MRHLKNDRYRQARGGRAYRIQLNCSRCNAHILTYQKDGDGQLKRCYLNRILEPESLMNSGSGARTEKDLSLVTCPQCTALIGIPITHYDNRLAYRLVPGSFTKRRVK